MAVLSIHVEGTTGSTQDKVPTAQTEPPTIPVAKFFPVGIFPEGELQYYLNEYVPRVHWPPMIPYLSAHFNSNAYRTTNEELRAMERLSFDQYNDLRKAAEVHRQVRAYAKKAIKPGMSMVEIANSIENGVRTLIEEKGLEAGMRHFRVVPTTQTTLIT